jgi:glycosyltransferase involved in cell wall biosynthesis
LLPQLNERCEVLIIDNASDTPVEGYLAENLPQKDAGPFVFRVIRNRANIGIGANILRCLEMSMGEWTWMIGDDDAPCSDALSKILKEVEGFDGVFVNFSCASSKLKAQVGSGVLEFLESSVTWVGMAFLPLIVHKTKEVQETLFFAYNTLSSANPHAAAMLLAIGEKGNWKFSSSEIVTRMVLPAEERWNTLKGLARTVFFPEQLIEILSNKERALLSKKILHDLGMNSFKSLYIIFYQTLMHITKMPEDYELCKFYFYQWVYKSSGKGVRFRSINLFAKILYYALVYHRTSFFIFQLYNFARMRRLRPYKVFGNIKRKDF